LQKSVQTIFSSQLKREQNQQIEELKVRASKTEQHAIDIEEQNIKHVELEDRFKVRLKELTLKTQEQHELVIFPNSVQTKSTCVEL
jgi:hypothetical protein